MGTQENPVFTLDSEFSEDEEIICSPTTTGSKHQVAAAKQHDEEDCLNEKTPFIKSASHNSDDNSINNVQLSCHLYVLVFISAIGGFLFGYDTGVISGAMIPIKRQFHLSYESQEIIVAITLVGAIIGAVSSAYLNDRFGRRIVLLIAAFSFTLGSITMGLAVNDVSLIIVGRFIVGLGIGYASMTVPIYIAEAVPPKIRGTLVTTNQLMITFGIFMASLINSLLSYTGSNGWRFMLGVGAIPGFIMFVGMFFLPESPRWLLINGQREKARDVFIKLRGDSNVDEELDHISQSIENAQDSFMDTLKKVGQSTGVKRALLVGCGLQAFQQLSAINTVMYYSATIIEMAGVEDESEILWMATIVSFGNFAVTIFAMFIVDRIKRRKLMIGSLFGTGVGLLIIASTFIFFYKNSMKTNFKPTLGLSSNKTFASKCMNYDRCFTCIENSKCGFCYTTGGLEPSKASCLPINKTRKFNDHRTDWCSNSVFNLQEDISNLKWSTLSCPSSTAWLAVSGMIFFLAAFAVGVGPLPWAINAEMYPLWARNVGQSAATSTNWTFNLVISLTFLNLIEWFTKPGVFIFYAILTFCGCLFLFLLLPETKGIRMEDVATLFDGKLLVPGKR
eukprot:TCONS_00066211-protein